MAWRVARSLDTLLGQLNRAYPGRSIASDGSIGDAAHATRDSDHNPWYVLDGWGIVTARDYTHDPAHGFDAHALAERLRLSMDRRIKYVISNGRIFAGAAGPSPWTWRPYTGSNPHSKHVHLSVVASRLCDDTTPWSAVTPVAASWIPDVDRPAPTPAATGTPAPLEDDMVRVMNFGDGHMWLVDIGAKTKWRIPGPGQLDWLEALGVPTVHGVQGGGVGSLFKEIS